jgi:hypothetical protein
LGGGALRLVESSEGEAAALGEFETDASSTRLIAGRLRSGS